MSRELCSIANVTVEQFASFNYSKTDSCLRIIVNNRGEDVSFTTFTMRIHANTNGTPIADLFYRHPRANDDAKDEGGRRRDASAVRAPRD